MKIWCITIGEPLPIDGSERLLRTGMLVQRLIDRGHVVTWWTSTFDHVRKQHRFETDTTVSCGERLTIVCLHAMSYRTNVSLRRFWNHYRLAAKFQLAAGQWETPDAIVCSYPTVELASVATRFAKQRGIPIIVDIRDLWPDAIVGLLPTVVRPVVRLGLAHWFRMARGALADATAIVGVSNGYLEWGLRRAHKIRSEYDRVFPIGYEPRSNRPAADVRATVKIEALGIDLSRRIALFIGTFGRTYDLSTVVRAARDSANAGDRSYQFVLCGSGDREQRWRREAGGLSNVLFTGWLQAPEIGVLLRHAWVGLAAYAAGAPQGLPNKLFEYMAAGLPIVCSLGVEGRDFITRHRCGFVYEPGDASRLVDCLRELKDSSTRARLSANSIAAFESEYSAKGIYERYANYVEEVSGFSVKCRAGLR